MTAGGQTAGWGAPRVLMLTADFAPGNWSGIGVAVRTQTEALCRRGVPVEVLWAAPEGRGPAGSASASASAPIAAGAPADAGELRVHPQGREACAVDPGSFDLVHLHSLALAELALELRRRYQLPLVYTSHSVVAAELAPGPERRLWSAVQRTLFALADRVIFLSAAERTLACRAQPELTGRSVVVSNGLPPAPPPPQPAPRGGPILFAGRWTQAKGVRLLERLVPRLLARRSDLRFLLAGGHGDREGHAAVARLRAAAGERCLIPGWCQPAELEQLYRRASLTVVPSEYEPFGLVALEAMRLGCPVVARAVGGLAEVVRPGSGGLLLADGEPERWEAALLDLLDDDRRHRALSLAGPAYVGRHFSAEAAADRLRLEVYPSLVPPAGPARWTRNAWGGWSAPAGRAA